MVWSSKSKDPTSILTITSSDPSRPVGPVGTLLPTSPVNPVLRTGQTGLCKTERLHTQPSSVRLDSALT